MDLTLLLTITLFVVVVLLTILFFKHNKLRNDFKNYNPNPVFGPGRYNYGQNNPSRILREMRLERIRKFLTFKWTWYWVTKEYRAKRKTRKKLNKTFKASIKKRKKDKARLLNDIALEKQ